MTRRASIHALAWVAWLVSILVVLTTTRNPLYLGIVLAWIALVSVAVRRTTDTGGNAGTSAQAVNISPVRFGLFVIAASAIFNGLTVHFGATILFTIPEQLPLIGGPVTLEAIVYGALNGAVIAGLFAAFLVMNRALSVRELVQLIPRAYYPVAVVVSIAITFVPTTLRQFRQIREAQAVRGHRMRGLRSWLPLFIPLLTGGLERALQLSEAMMARGFASTDVESPGSETHDLRSRIAIIGGLLLFVAGWLLRLIWNQPWLGLALLVIGMTLVLGSIWLVGRRHPHTVYRPQPWRLRDWAVVAGAAITAAAFVVPWPGLDRSSIFYYPYPRLTIPTFSLILGMATWGLVAPALVIMIDSLDSPRQVDAEIDGFASPNSENIETGNIERDESQRQRGGQVNVSSI
jgi:energy-coupling factor transport system permease protein